MRPCTLCLEHPSAWPGGSSLAGPSVHLLLFLGPLLEAPCPQCRVRPFGGSWVSEDPGSGSLPLGPQLGLSSGQRGEGLPPSGGWGSGRRDSRWPCLSAFAGRKQLLAEPLCGCGWWVGGCVKAGFRGLRSACVQFHFESHPSPSASLPCGSGFCLFFKSPAASSGSPRRSPHRGVLSLDREGPAWSEAAVVTAGQLDQRCVF